MDLHSSRKQEWKDYMEERQNILLWHGHTPGLGAKPPGCNGFQSTTTVFVEADSPLARLDGLPKAPKAMDLYRRWRCVYEAFYRERPSAYDYNETTGTPEYHQWGECALQPAVIRHEEDDSKWDKYELVEELRLVMGLLKVSDEPNERTDRIIRIGRSNEAISVGEIAKNRNSTPRRAVLRLEEVSAFCHITGKAAICWWQDEYWNTPDGKIETSSSAGVDIEPLATIVDKRANAILVQEAESWKTEDEQGWRSWLWGVQIITPDVASRSSVAVRLRGGADSATVQVAVSSSEDGRDRKAAYDMTLGIYSPEGNRQHYLKVWFRKEVLNKYYHDERYTVEQLTVKCGSRWSIRCDTEASSTAVWTYWGDFAGLPESEGMHWAAYSIPPRREESEAAYRAFTTGRPPTTDTPRRKITLLRRQVDKAWNRLTGTPLYTKLDSKDERELRVVRVQQDLSEDDIGKITLALDKVAVDTLRPGKNAKERKNQNRLEVLTRHADEIVRDARAKDAVHRGIQELRRVRARRHEAAHARTREPQGDTPRTAHDVVTGTIHGLQALLQGLEREIGARAGVGTPSEK